MMFCVVPAIGLPSRPCPGPAAAPGAGRVLRGVALRRVLPYLRRKRVPRSGVLLFVSQNYSLGLLTLWMASGTLLIARVAALSYRYNTKVLATRQSSPTAAAHFSRACVRAAHGPPPARPPLSY